MIKHRRKYSRPRKPWDKERLEYEKGVCTAYGIRRKKEIWRAEGILRELRQRARVLNAHKDKEQERILLDKLRLMGLIKTDSNLDDVLALTLENLLDRRLETVVFRKGLAKTPKQARQFIVHGHVTVEGRRVRWPSTIIHSSQEPGIDLSEELRKTLMAVPKPATENAEVKKVEGA